MKVENPLTREQVWFLIGLLAGAAVHGPVSVMVGI